MRPDVETSAGRKARRISCAAAGPIFVNLLLSPLEEHGIDVRMTQGAILRRVSRVAMKVVNPRGNWGTAESITLGIPSHTPFQHVKNKGRGVLLVPFFFYWSRLHELEKVSKTMGWVEEGGRWHSKRQRCRQEFEVTRASWT